MKALPGAEQPFSFILNECRLIWNCTEIDVYKASEIQDKRQLQLGELLCRPPCLDHRLMLASNRLCRARSASSCKTSTAANCTGSSTTAQTKRRRSRQGIWCTHSTSMFSIARLSVRRSVGCFTSDHNDKYFLVARLTPNVFLICTYIIFYLLYDELCTEGRW